VEQEETITPKTNDEKALLAFRRLLLAKQLYLHGLDHSNRMDALNKMISIHNFHNAIEIVLRAILLQYEIRSDKQLNIEFEVMLNEIDNHQPFKDTGIRLPYRQELRNLNQLRNLVQHHATEPPSSTMEEWRVFTRGFLEQVCQSHFNLEFDKLSSLDLIEDVNLRELLRLSLSSIQEQNFKKSLRLAKIAFEWADEVVMNLLPNEAPLGNSLFSRFHPFKDEDLLRVFSKLIERSRKAEYYIALLSTGVSLPDYKRFESSTEWLIGPKSNPSEETARWVHNFVVNIIINWQILGLNPRLSSWNAEVVKKIVEGSTIV
jgi:hypothetical protein